MKSKLHLILSIAAALAVVTFLARDAAGDDVGITEVRLIAEDGNTYSLEADVSPYQLQGIRAPILPARAYMLGEPALVSVGQMIVVRFRFTTGDAPLGPEDRLLLPWQRAGVVVTSYWLDGSSKRAFFDRRLEGIPISLSRLLDVEISGWQLVSAAAADSARHLMDFGWLHVLLVLSCLSAGSWRRTAGLLLALAAGHGLSLVATDLGASSVSVFIAVIAMSATAAVVFRSSIVHEEGRSRLWPVFLLLGIVHGLLYAGPVSSGMRALTSDELLVARFVFNATVDTAHAAIGLVVFSMITLLSRAESVRRLRKVALYCGGGLAVAAVFVQAPPTGGPVEANVELGSRFATGIPRGPGSTTTASRPVEVTDPLMGYMTVTPFEVRIEWLVRVRDRGIAGTPSTSGDPLIPVEAQPALKSLLAEQFGAGTIVKVDGKRVEAASASADFVTVGSYGVTTRTAPVPEPIRQAVVGVTLAYPLADVPSVVEAELVDYPTGVPSVPMAVTDPWGATPHRITADARTITWEKRMAGFRRPVVQAVKIPPPTWPAASALFVLAAAAVMVIGMRRQIRRKTTVAVACCVAAVALYPFVRPAVPDALNSSAPSETEARQALTQLLTNIYRAFDYRTEDAIYDRLSVSATGDQLSAIYLGQRNAMTLENRGGARATVNEVDVEKVNGVRRDGDGFVVDAEWTVSGSVSHFGHVHYRTNRYHADVRVVEAEGAWKIDGIEVKVEERVL